MLIRRVIGLTVMAIAAIQATGIGRRSGRRSTHGQAWDRRVETFTF